tara:strand:- start:4634 stop:6016 length:1383 start_codon:yes stop_codon:yes gene_type:complete
MKRTGSDTDLARPAVPPSRDGRLRAAFRNEEYAGFRFTILVRSAALVVIGIWLQVVVPWPRVSYFLAFITLFLASGLVAEWMRRKSSRPALWTAAFIFIDACLLTYVLLAPNPFSDSEWPIQVTLRFHNHLYMFLFLIFSGLSYSPVMVLWTGVSIAATWSAAVFYIHSLPNSVTEFAAGTGTPEALRNLLDPYFVNTIVWQNQVALLLIGSMIIAASVWRARRLVRQQVIAEEARGNLSRYFSPNVVERLATAPGNLDIARSQNVAILFVDVIGFTKMSEDLPPERMIAQVREFHHRMVEQVFEHGGSIDKFMGDCVMATFGTPVSGPSDATNALRCSVAILDEVREWNASRRAAGLNDVGVGLGLHYGKVVVGNVGAERRLEFTVMGDPVNVTSRLERLTRDYDTPIIASDDLIEQVRREHDAAADLIDSFTDLGTLEIRGRRGDIRAWRYGPVSAAV